LHTQIVPPHLYKMQYFNLHLHDYTSKSKFNEIKNSFTKRLLRIELNDAYRTLNHSRNWIFHLVCSITRSLPWRIFQPLFDNHDKNLYSMFIRGKQRIDKKLKWLKDRRNKLKNKNIKRIEYYWFPPDMITQNPDPQSSLTITWKN